MLHVRHYPCTGGIANAWLYGVMSGICVCVCFSVCVHAVKEKRLELQTPNLVRIGLLYGRTSACIDLVVKRLQFIYSVKVAGL